MTNIPYAFLCSAVTTFLDRVHAHIHIGSGSALSSEPFLKLRAHNCFGSGDSLNRFAGRSISHKNRRVVTGLEQLPYIFGGCKRFRRECVVSVHSWSCLAWKTAL